MSFKIPNALNQIRQGNRGDIHGELYETFNIDLSTSPGKVRTSDRLAKVLDGTTDFATAAAVVDMSIFHGFIYALSTENVQRCAVGDDPTLAASWDAYATISTDPDLYSTATVFGGDYLMSRGTNISRLTSAGSFTSSWWTGTVSGTALTAGKPHVLHTHRGGQETLFLTDGNLVRYYNATAGHATITLQADLTASCVDSGVSAIWVGTLNENSGNAYVYEMYVGDTLARNAYQVDGRAVLALWIKDNIPYIVTERGHIQMFNGAGFQTIASFPFVLSGRTLDGVRPGLIQDSSTSRPIHPRGVKVHNDSAFLLLNAESDQDDYAVTTRTHSGVWEFDHTSYSLTHRHGVADGSTDYGAASLSRSGPLLIVDNSDCFLLVGCQTDTVGLFATSGATNQGWFITPEIASGTIQDAYQRVIHKASGLSASDTINTLYRTRKRATVYLTANWLDSTHFTTLDDASGIAVGELVRVSHGYGAGEWATITAMSASALTTTVTVNRAIGSTGEVSYLYSDNFKLIDAEYTSTDGEYKSVGVSETNPWIQYMVMLKGPVEYRSFDSVEAPKTQKG